MILFNWCLKDCFESCAYPVSSCLGCLPSWSPQQSVQLNCVLLCVTAITKGPLPHTGKLWNMYFPKVPLMVFSIYHLCFPKDLCGNKIPLLTRFILLPNYTGDAAQSAPQVTSRFIITKAAARRRGLAIPWQTEHLHTNTLATNQQWPGKS